MICIPRGSDRGDLLLIIICWTLAGHKVISNGYVINYYVLRDDDIGPPISICHCSLARFPADCYSIPVVLLLSSEHHHSSSRRCSCDGSASLTRVSCNSAGLWTNPALASSFTSAAAALACMRPSSASLRVKRAISESYSSHSGICRARESFGSFCVCISAVC